MEDDGMVNHGTNTALKQLHYSPILAAHRAMWI
jgi:hypothetical protein